MTFAEFERLPPAKLRDANIAKRLFLALYELVDRMRRQDPNCPLGEVHHKVGYRVSRDPDSWLAPDVSVMHADQRIETYPEGAPAIAVEVTSDSISAPKLNAKMRAHAAAGAREVWTVYPDAGYVWTYYPARSLAERGAQAIRSELIPSAASDLRLDLILGTE